MTMTNKNSGSRLRKLTDAPIVDEKQVAHLPSVLLKLTYSRAGYNSGEIARFKGSVAASWLEKKWAVLAEVDSTDPDHALSLNRAIKLVIIAGDARKLLSEQEKTALLSFNAAEEAVDTVMEMYDTSKENVSGPRLALEEVHEAKTYQEEQLLDDAVANVKKIKSSLNGFIKKAKTAKNKVSANLAVEKATGLLAIAEDEEKATKKLAVANQKARVKMINEAKAVENEQLNSSSQSIAKLNKVIDRYKNEVSK